MPKPITRNWYGLWLLRPEFELDEIEASNKCSGLLTYLSKEKSLAPNKFFVQLLHNLETFI